VAEHRCKKVFAALSEYLDGNLPVRSCRELERHLKDCPPCVAYLETLKSTVKACQEYSVGQVPAPSPRVRAALLDAMRKITRR
jgi:anti-sigma factor (TIGR02949 family)